MNAVAVEDFAFDRRGFHGFIAHKLDGEDRLVVLAHMPVTTEQHPRLTQELRFQFLEPGFAVSEVRPIRLLPVPDHER